jgi:hypothetical protein
MNVISRNKLTDIEALRQYYADKRGRIELTEHQEAVRQRVVTAHSLLLEARPKQEVCGTLMQRFDISDRQAYTDIKNAYKLFGEVNRSEKEGLRHIVQELALETFRKAKEMNDLTGMNKALSNIIKLGGLDREDPDLPDFEKLKQAIYPIILDDPVRDIFMKLIDQQGSIDLTKFMSHVAQQAEPAEYTDVSDQPDQAGDSETP